MKPGRSYVGWIWALVGPGKPGGLCRGRNRVRIMQWRGLWRQFGRLGWRLLVDVMARAMES